jgi:hypothetical protein
MAILPLMISYGTERSVFAFIKFHEILSSQTRSLGLTFSVETAHNLLVIYLEVRGFVVGIILSILGFVVFLLGIVNMTQTNAISNSILVVIGIFLGMAGLLILITNIFSGGSLFALLLP